MTKILYTPREQRRYKKSSRIHKKVIFCVILFFILMGGALYVTRLSRLQVAKIEISGNQTLPEDLIRKNVEKEIAGVYAFILSKKFILFSRAEMISKALRKEFPVIGEIKVVKQYPDILSIHLSERKLFAIYCNDLVTNAEDTAVASTTAVSEVVEKKDIQCAYIDRTGFAYEKAPSSSGSLIIQIASDKETVESPAQLIDTALVSKMQYVIEKMQEISGERIVGFELPSRLVSEFRARTSKGYRLLFKRDDDLENQMNVLKVVLDTEIKGNRERLEYVDLRFGNKVFYKMK